MKPDQTPLEAFVHDPTPAQARILRMIVEYRSANGMNPTHRELAQRAGLAHATVWEHIEALREKNLIRHVRNHRSCYLTEEAIAWLGRFRGCG